MKPKSEKSVQEIREATCAAYNTAFDALKTHGIPHTFQLRKLAGLYAVASIGYYGNDHSFISDELYDQLCVYLHERYGVCVAEGADLLDMELVAFRTGYDMDRFVQPYHDITAMLLNNTCRCIRCSAS